MPRLMTYNVHRWLGTDLRTDPDRIADVIASAAPDVVALQEAHIGRARFSGRDALSRVADRLGMEVHFQPTISVMGERFGIAILSRLPSRTVRAGVLPRRGRGPALERRSALWVEVEAVDGPLQVVTAHLAVLDSRDRLLQARALAGPDWMGAAGERGPAVLLGDFNAGPKSAACRHLTESLACARQVTSLVQPTFHARLPILSIDHVFGNAAVEIRGAAAVLTPLARVASDHLPLHADVERAQAPVLSVAA